MAHSCSKALTVHTYFALALLVVTFLLNEFLAAVSRYVATCRPRTGPPTGKTCSTRTSTESSPSSPCGPWHSAICLVTNVDKAIRLLHEGHNQIHAKFITK